MTELPLLYYFKTVAEMENITKAAESLYISQPALSKAISKLERTLDVTLFDRKKGRISLSSMGRIYYQYVASAFQVLEQGEHQLELLRQESNDSIAIASPVGDWLSALVYEFVSSCQDSDRLSIKQYLYSEYYLESELLSGNLDFVVTPITIENNEIEQRKLAEEEIFLVVGRSHPFAEKKYIRLAECRNDAFLINESSFDAKIVERLCSLVGFAPHILLHTNEAGALYDALIHNLGISLIPASALYHQDLNHLSILRITDLEVVRLISIAKRRDRYLPPNANRLYHYAVNYYQNLGAELQSHFDSIFTETIFPGRTNFGINELKTDSAPRISATSENQQ